MSAASWLAELKASGVHLSLSGDDLRYQTRPGVSIGPYRERIVASKTALVAELLKAEITAAVNVEPPDLDRPAYVRLMARWYAAEADLAAGYNGDESERSRQPRAETWSAGDACAGVDHIERPTEPADSLLIDCGKPEVCGTLGRCPGYHATSICPPTPTVKTEPAA